MVAPTGRLVFVGITTEEVAFRHPVFHKPEGTLLCSRNALPRDFMRIIKLIEDGQIDTAPWITHHLAFDDVVSQFENYTRPETGAIKAIIVDLLLTGKHRPYSWLSVLKPDMDPIG